ncbi:hypothetical protein M8J76_002596 [Diaphorina citri]|nr:hypothetical protein M8J77_005283 [Diaphorina citri]KAI5708756.1 hypothetical protein M8J76_002596 [Diaphorina citri]
MNEQVIRLSGLVVNGFLYLPMKLRRRTEEGEEEEKKEEMKKNKGEKEEGEKKKNALNCNTVHKCSDQ